MLGVPYALFDHLRKFRYRSVKRFGDGRGQISHLAIAIDFHRRFYNTFALPCECVMVVIGAQGGHVEFHLN